MPGEDAHAADRLADLIAAAGIEEEAAQPFRRDIVDNALRIEPRAGEHNRVMAKIGGEYLERNVFAQIFGKFQKGDGDRIGFLAGQTIDHPKAQRLITGALLDEFGKDLLLQSYKGLRVAEETGHSGSDVLVKLLGLFFMVAQIIGVSSQPVELEQRHPPPDAPLNDVGLVIAEVQTAHITNQAQNLF